MLSQRLQARCPSAMAIGIAKAVDYTLCFDKKSADNSGKCTLLKTNNMSDIAYGVLFRIDTSERDALDDAEGFPEGYARDDSFTVVSLTDQKCIPTSTYIANKCVEGLRPYSWYHALVLAGAMEHKLPPDYIQTLAKFPYASDPDPKKNDREQKALTILKKAGYAHLFSEEKG